MRGEDRRRICESSPAPGSPPHARGRHGPGVPMRRGRRITPACAGKTHGGDRPLRQQEDHPRMRGEDSNGSMLPMSDGGSPPHARGRRMGDTIAQKISVDHPRMRGEDDDGEPVWLKIDGSPPHARGRPTGRRANAGTNRITPACAGKTATGTVRIPTVADHPRMRGEDAARLSAKRLRTGSPPHARGRLFVSFRFAFRVWITPACAGKTVRLPRESDKVVFQLTSFPSLPT